MDKINTQNNAKPQNQNQNRHSENKTPLKITLSIITVLVILICILYPIYINQNKDAREAYKNREIVIKVHDEIIGKYKFDELLRLVEPEEFEATFKRSAMPKPQVKTYTGLSVPKLMDVLEIDSSDIEGMITKSSDGFTKTYNHKDIFTKGNMFIAFKVDGEPFEIGIDNKFQNKDDGGPFVLILAHDKFSQNRTRLLAEINFI